MHIRKIEWRVRMIFSLVSGHHLSFEYRSYTYTNLRKYQVIKSQYSHHSHHTSAWSKYMTFGRTLEATHISLSKEAWKYTCPLWSALHVGQIIRRSPSYPASVRYNDQARGRTDLIGRSYWLQARYTALHYLMSSFLPKWQQIIFTVWKCRVHYFKSMLQNSTNLMFSFCDDWTKNVNVMPSRTSHHDCWLLVKGCMRWQNSRSVPCASASQEVNVWTNAKNLPTDDNHPIGTNDNTFKVFEGPNKWCTASGDMKSLP